MVDNGLGVTMLPQMALEAGILDNTRVVARPLETSHPSRRIALVWRKGSPRQKEFEILADALRQLADVPRRNESAARASAARQPA